MIIIGIDMREEERIATGNGDQARKRSWSSQSCPYYIASSTTSSPTPTRDKQLGFIAYDFCAMCESASKTV